VKKLLILGKDGMLGNECFRVISEYEGIEVIGTSRKKEGIRFQAGSDSLAQLIESTNPDFVLNCIGVIKPSIEDTPKSIKNAVLINSALPYELYKATVSKQIKVFQIATDCVYSGLNQNNNELSLHDPVDVYGKTKSLGEVSSDNFMQVRCSIVGNEINHKKSLFEWFKNQPVGAKVNGYVNHHWNGVTTKLFAELVARVIVSNQFLPGKHHLVPKNSVNKHELLNMFGKVTGRSDILIEPYETETSVFRNISTIYPEINEKLWSIAGYGEIPSIEDLILKKLH
jgi:dTDP-4-dehydrorhamnose reductase